MPWFKVDDTLSFHPKVMAAGNSAMGLWVRAGSWSMQQLTDGHVPKPIARGLGTPTEARRLVQVGLWIEDDDGYRFHEWGERQPSRTQVRADRRAAAERQRVARSPELRQAVRERDRGCCRYCGIAVRWNDRRGGAGGTYDHVDPRGESVYENLVVACRGCNTAKGRRTPEQAGMSLRPPPGPKSDLGMSQVGIDSVSESSQDPDPTRPDPGKNYG